MMKRRTAPELPQGLVGIRRQHHRGPIDRRSFLGRAGRVAAALTVVPVSEVMRPTASWTTQVAKVSRLPSARVLDQLRTRFTFQISVDVATIEQGLAVAGGALAGGITIVEMGTPLLKNEGVSNVVPAFRRRFPEALLLADMKTMDGGTFEARAVFAGGGNIIDFLALAGMDTARAICAVRDEFRRDHPDLPRLVFADILVPHQGPAAQAVDVALRMLDAGVDAVGVHLRPMRGALTPHSSRNSTLVTWRAPSSMGSAAPRRYRWSAG